MTLAVERKAPMVRVWWPGGDELLEGEHGLVVAGVAELAYQGRGAGVARMVLTRDLACDLEI